MALYNFLSRRGGHGHLSWDISHRGPLHAPTWVAIAKSEHIINAVCSFIVSSHSIYLVDDLEYGRGEGKSKHVAMEIAAQQAHVALLEHEGRLRVSTFSFLSYHSARCVRHPLHSIP
jgi:hypothetical protein